MNPIFGFIFFIIDTVSRFLKTAENNAFVMTCREATKLL